MKYDNTIISYYSEDYIRDFIKYSSSYTIKELYDEFLKGHDRDDVINKKRICIEHYIVKNYKTTTDVKLKAKMDEYLNYVYNAMHPSNPKDLDVYLGMQQYSKSLFLHKNNINVLYRGRDLSFINSFKNNLKSRVKSIADSYLAGKDISEKGKKCMLSYFCYIIENYKTYSNEYKEFEQAINTYYSELMLHYEPITRNIYEIEFICKLAISNVKTLADNIGDYELIVSSVINHKKDTHQGGHACRNFIVINPDGYADKNFEITKTAVHEYQHLIQYAGARNGKHSKYALDYILNELIGKYSNRDANGNYVDEYHLNYEYDGIELDSEEYGFFETSVIANSCLSHTGRYSREQIDKLDKIIKADKKRRVDKRRPECFAYKKYVNGSQSYYTMPYIYNIKRLTEILSRHPEEMNNYPVLKEFFFSNGSLRGFKEILTRDYQSSVNLFYSKFSSDFLRYHVNNGALAKFDFGSLSEIDQGRAGSRLIDVTTKVMEDVIKVNNEYASYNFPNVTKLTAEKTYIANIIELSNYIKFFNDNIDLFMNIEKNKNSNHYSDHTTFATTLLKYIDSYDRCEIYNLLNDKEKETLENFKKLVNDFKKNLFQKEEKNRFEKHKSYLRQDHLDENRRIINDFVSRYPRDILNTLIIWPTGRISTLDIFLKEYVYYMLYHGKIRQFKGNELDLDTYMKDFITRENVANISSPSNFELLSKKEKINYFQKMANLYRLLDDTYMYYESNLDYVVTDDYDDRQTLDYYKKRCEYFTQIGDRLAANEYNKRIIALNRYISESDDDNLKKAI